MERTMMRKTLDRKHVGIAAAILLVPALVMFNMSAAADIARPATGEGPVQVRVTMFVLDVDEVNTAGQSFDANVYIECMWHDPRLAHDSSGEVARPLVEVWNPRIQFVNQQRIMYTFPEMVEVTPEGEVAYRQRVWGAFSMPLDLEDFPFDSQEFHIQLAAAGYAVNEVELVRNPDAVSGIARKFSLPDWEVLDWSITSGAFQTSPGEESFSGYTLIFEARRHSRYFVVKVILPLVLIIAMSWLVFWIDPELAGTQINVAVTVMLTLIAYRFAVGASLPTLPYLTRLDYFILSATFLVFAALVEVVVTSCYAHAGKIERARAIDRWSRFVFPSLTILITVETLALRWGF
jgi:hypothetical protein